MAVPWDTLRRFALLTGLYFAGAVLATLYLRTPEDVTLFWPSAGVGYAVVVRYGLRWVVIVPAAMALLHALVLPVPAAFLPYSLGSNTLATLLAGWYVHRQRRDLHLEIGDGLLLLRGGVLLGLVSAAIGTVGLVESGMLPPGDSGRGLVLWTLGDVLGITTLAPSLSLLFGREDGAPRMRIRGGEASRRERIAWGATLALCLAAIWIAGRSGNLYALGLVSLPLALLLWAAIRFSPLLAMLATIAVVVFLSLLTGIGLGGFTRPLTLLDSAVLMLLLILISVIPVMLSVSNYEKRSTAIALFRRATLDPLTGLLNRSTFEERAREQLATGDGELALLYLDLDHFKLVNDATSHVAGDDLIRGVADLFATEFERTVLVARTGGDEFAALLPASRAAATASARRLLAAIDALRVPWQAQVLTTTASIGLAFGRAPHVDFDSLLSHADAACFAAKELGGNRMLAAAPDSDEMQVRAATMRSALQVREALDERRFVLYCQPIVDLIAPRPPQRHFEILLRWTDAGGVVRAPAELIAAAERYRLGPRLDRYVVDATLNWLEQHPDAAAMVEHCSINLGGATLVDEEFSDYFAARLRRSNVPTERLCLEITETSVVRDRSRAQRFIGRMRELGCRFALDDFGTGFCSFGYLQDLDVDYLKIDGSFVRDLEHSPLAEAVVRSITDIAHVLDKRTVAEQAQTEAQLDRLRRMGVDYAQGYVFRHPQPIDAFFAAPAA
ncbi:EAL domain-containing protein [Luteimonas sp. 50]|uniref:EAL domain-containing protein n=1 Tax=Cognatiluteimonas sedimenti TaxID=2927791 RepID=A0ABT0A459_9GAMM|nr:EAL domain-containing protein [Lysobacter sedimenti]MCJ0825757.1 EAL domain-containing protein [Lysobacter sedimenti]